LRTRSNIQGDADCEAMAATAALDAPRAGSGDVAEIVEVPTEPTLAGKSGGKGAWRSVGVEDGERIEVLTG
jgi:hypothetical protein